MIPFRFFGVCSWWLNSSQNGLNLGPQEYRDVSSHKSAALDFFFKRTIIHQTVPDFTISTWIPNLPQRHFCPWMNAKLLLLRGRYKQGVSYSAILLISLPIAIFFSWYFSGVSCLITIVVLKYLSHPRCLLQIHILEKKIHILGIHRFTKSEVHRIKIKNHIFNLHQIILM